MTHIDHSDQGVTALILETGAVAQLHPLYEDGHYGSSAHEIGFALRIWQPHGCTYTDQGEGSCDDGRAHNLTTLSAHVLFDKSGAPKLDSLEYRATDYVTELVHSAARRREAEVAASEAAR